MEYQIVKIAVTKYIVIHKEKLNCRLKGKRDQLSNLVSKMGAEIFF